jgi:chromosome condensin MukBEF MukE localization factor
MPPFTYIKYFRLIHKIIMLYNDIGKEMVFTLDEMKLLQAINNKSPHEYTDEEKVIVRNICEKNKESKIKQSQYFRKYLKTDKGKIAHRKASKKYYNKIKAQREAEKQAEIQKNKDLFSKYIKVSENEE